MSYSNTNKVSVKSELFHMSLFCVYTICSEDDRDFYHTNVDHKNAKYFTAMLSSFDVIAEIVLHMLERLLVET